MKEKLLIIIIIIISVYSCNNDTANFKDGKLSSSFYENDYFDLQISIDKHWIAQNDSANQKLFQSCMKLIANGEEYIEDNIMETKHEKSILLNLVNSENNSSIVFFAEKDGSFFWQSTNLEKYLVQVKSLLNHTSFNYNFINENGVDIERNNLMWKLLETKFSKDGSIFFQDILLYKSSGYFLSIISTYSDKTEKGLINEQIAKIVID